MSKGRRVGKCVKEFLLPTRISVCWFRNHVRKMKNALWGRAGLHNRLWNVAASMRSLWKEFGECDLSSSSFSADRHRLTLNQAQCVHKYVWTETAITSKQLFKWKTPSHTLDTVRKCWLVLWMVQWFLHSYSQKPPVWILIYSMKQQIIKYIS